MIEIYLLFMNNIEMILPRFNQSNQNRHENDTKMTLKWHEIWQAFEWSVEATQLASKLKVQDAELKSAATAKHLLHQVDHFLGVGDVDVAGVTKEDVPALLTQLKSLAAKLPDNPKLTQQCNVIIIFFNWIIIIITKLN